jgi:opacity protein-like surface antigen
MRFAAPLVLLVLSAPAQAEDLLPFFANDAALSARSPWNSPEENAHRWDGLTMGTEVFAGSGIGKGGRGGFGGDLHIGYLKELDNNIVVGIGASAGYAPSFVNCGPRGFGFGMADVKVGYDLGRFMPYVTFGVGRETAVTNGRGWSGLDSVNDMFASHGPSATLTKVGAGFDYEVNEHLHIGAEFSAVQVRGNAFGPPLAPQPGALP